MNVLAISLVVDKKVSACMRREDSRTGRATKVRVSVG